MPEETPSPLIATHDSVVVAGKVQIPNLSFSLGGSTKQTIHLALCLLTQQRTIRGAQIGLFGTNLSKDLYGVQIGVFNVCTGRSTKSVQIGSINSTRDSSALKIGLVNYHPGTRLQMLAFGGNTTKINLAARFLDGHWYTLMGFELFYRGLDDKFSGSLFYRAGYRLNQSHTDG